MRETGHWSSGQTGPYLVVLSSASAPDQYLATYSCSPVLRLNLVTPSFAPVKMTSDESTPSILAVTPIGILVSMVLTDWGPSVRSTMNNFLLLMSCGHNQRYQLLANDESSRTNHVAKFMTLLGIIWSLTKATFGGYIGLTAFSTLAIVTADSARESPLSRSTPGLPLLLEFRVAVPPVGTKRSRKI